MKAAKTKAPDNDHSSKNGEATKDSEEKPTRKKYSEYVRRFDPRIPR